MDELEIRRRLLTDPNDDDEGLRAALRQSPDQARYAAELRRLDEQLARAMAVPVPDQLAERILLGCSFEQRRSARSPLWQLALAASVAFALGLGVSHWWPQLSGGPGPYLAAVPGGDLYAHAVGHYLAEADEMQDIDEHLNVIQVNHKLATLGGDFTTSPGRIYFANFCSFDGVRSLHLVLQGEQQRVALFVVPTASTIAGPRMVGDVKAVALPQGRHTLLVVGPPAEPLEQMATDVSRKLRWQAI
ncbi:MAG: DUF3379 family protein [Gammaproteobacteria bacterium]|nr:DUF3379 family protein [Gammaproteobacteria bacterium]